MSKKQFNDLISQTQFQDYLKEMGYREFTPTGKKSTVYDYSRRIDRVCKREQKTWQELAANIEGIIIKYDTNGIEEEYGAIGKRSVINALKRYKEYIEKIKKVKLTNKKFVIVDLFSGSYHINHEGHELFNLKPNQINGRFYGYVPHTGNLNIEKLGAKKNDDFVDGVLVIFVEKISDKNSNRIVTGFYPSARVYRNKKLDEKLNRSFFDKKDGTWQTATYCLESNELIKVPKDITFLIKIGEYNPQMFRAQRIYPGTYPELDKKILTFIKKIQSMLLDEDFDFQNSIQGAKGASQQSVEDAPNRELKTEDSLRGKIVKRDASLSKRAIIDAKHKCEFNPNHKTFEYSNGIQYMEGHHLIPCTLTNAKKIKNKFGKHIDCVENIVSLCPNCHRKIHFSHNDSKKEMIVKLFDKQKSELKRVGINISFSELLKLYDIINPRK